MMLCSYTTPVPAYIMEDRMQSPKATDETVREAGDIAAEKEAYPPTQCVTYQIQRLSTGILNQPSLIAA